MNTKNLSACTTILVGKNASIDGSTMIARNDDTFGAISPHKFEYHPAQKNTTDTEVKSWLNGFKAQVPADSFGWPGVPNVDYQHEGYYDESGINTKNVAMSATESTYGNERALAYDPLVVDGLDEDCIVRMVLPYVTSARQAVERTGALIKEYGSPAGNSVLFSDHNDVWYMEIVTGHHWVAQRIPDDAYAIAANRVSIQQVDFNNTQEFMWSDDIQDFVKQNHLNTDQTGWNFRHIFGTNNQKDRHYNNPRVWFGQRYLNPEIEQDPEDGELPFICRTNHKISIDDLEYILGSHYNETPYDPMQQGESATKYLYRPIGLNRTQNSHILQIRNDVPEELAGIMWLCIGFPTFAPFLPFYTNMKDTAPSFSHTSMNFDIKDAYWLYNGLSMLVESHYHAFIQSNIDFLTESRRRFREVIAEVDQQAAQYQGTELTDFLTQQNQALVEETEAKTRAYMGTLFTQGIELSKLTFNMDKNL
ncbi:C69 family dipeptidase [Bombilactobacillus thymidiniphilus]|uniref:Dipeptidase n=1 Tax=Bombilactobacillus thymidiniphilus TaxID=2923363 RepID=A0ABY4PFH8_9LACO|nr:C69 family dipeptidase [Bombilactobacillus thymidiniphilus]UQS84276.1 C69 family dipeptidase [Bombilactobacillus thymidiniphilus]